MKILFVVPSLGMGGAERVLALLADSWALEHSIHILTLTDEQDFYILPERIKRHRIITVHKHWYNICKIIGFIAKIRKTFVEVNPDFIISFLVHPNILSLVSGFFLRKKIIVCERNIIRDSHINKRLDFLRRRLYPHAYKITVQHEQIYQELISVYPGISLKKIYVTPNPVNKFVVTGKHLDMNSYFPSFNRNDFLMIGVGRFTPVKAFKDLITVFYFVHKKNQNARLAILGDGEEYNECVNLVKELSVDNFVSLPGMTADVHLWYSAADIFVTTTYFEGFPNALAESLAAGLPAVAFDAPSISVLLKDGINGYVIKERNHQLMAEKILLLLENADMYRRMSEAAKKVSDEYSIENINKIWFDQVLV